MANSSSPAHENPSHTAIATKPSSASDIRYAVMLAFSHFVMSSSRAIRVFRAHAPLKTLMPGTGPGIAKDETPSGRIKYAA
jgi:hypothetical protein